MFIYIKDKSDRIVNLDSVSSIALLDKDHRVVFNMVYPCTLSSMGTKKEGVEIADYIYWDSYSDGELNALLQCQYVNDNFIKFPNHNRLINKQHIASIKIDENRKRIIINIKCSIRLYAGADLSSDFIFIDAPNDEMFTQYKGVVLSLINGGI